MRAVGRLVRAAWLSLLAIGMATAASHAQSYPTLASQPDPKDFVNRADTRLTLLGDGMRFVGFDIGWLTTGADGARSAPPDAFEIQDALATVQALDGTVLRIAPIPVIAEANKPAHPDPAALAALDLVLKTARDMGLKVIVPLADSGAGSGGNASACPSDASSASSASGPICAYLHGRNLTEPARFFTDPGVQADFLAGAALVFDHVNTLTGLAYRDDPTIMAWENCLACGAAADAGAVSSWSERLGQAAKAADPRHLYENGAFAGRIEPTAPHPVPAAIFATPSVDIVGDDLATASDPNVARTRLGAAAGSVAAASRVYVLDSLGWTPALWKTTDGLETWLGYATRERDLSGVIVGRLKSHASAGGYLPPAPSVPAQGIGSLYFPGIKTPDMDSTEMRIRARALRRFAFGMSYIIMTPAYLLPPKPDVISVKHGHVVWRGAAGALSYSIERSPDPSAAGSWQLVCDACANDSGDGWQDPSPTSPPAWYRIIPININGHKAVPSDPIQSTN